jgi:hypothetical protein
MFVMDKYSDIRLETIIEKGVPGKRGAMIRDKRIKEKQTLSSLLLTG